MAAAPIPAEPPKPLVIWFSAPIDQNSTDTLMNVLTNAYMQGIRDVHLLISTSGGGIMNGMTLFNFLRGLPINLTTHNVGNVDSIGNVIFLAGERRFACAHSTFMFHGVAWNTAASASLGEQMLSEFIANVKSDQHRISNLIVERTRLEGEAVDGMFTRAETKSADEALTCGLIHEIRDVQIPSDAIVASLTAPAPQGSGRQS
jgi:ATP-dependent protease ClpP protease subunit